MSDFKCKKCGKDLPNKHEWEMHELNCKGVSFDMGMLEKIAAGGIESLSDVAFECTICGEGQVLPKTYQPGVTQVFPVCDNCKSDLKDIILTKRKKDEKT